jgi:hypothetical protein
LDSVKNVYGKSSGPGCSGCAKVVSLEGRERRAGVVVVEFLQQQDVGTHALDDFRHRARLRVVRRGKIALQCARRRD